MLGPPSTVGVGVASVAVTTCGGLVTFGVGVTRGGAVPHKNKPTQ